MTQHYTCVVAIAWAMGLVSLVSLSKKPPITLLDKKTALYQQTIERVISNLVPRKDDDTIFNPKKCT